MATSTEIEPARLDVLYRRLRLQTFVRGESR